MEDQYFEECAVSLYLHVFSAGRLTVFSVFVSWVWLILYLEKQQGNSQKEKKDTRCMRVILCL